MTDDEFDHWKAEYMRGLDLFWKEETLRIMNDYKVIEAQRKARYEGSTWHETTANERYYQGLWPYD